MKPPATPFTSAGHLAAPRPEPIAPTPATPIDSQLLLQGRREVVIVHQGQHYRLQATRAGKLILVK